jgi:hypothetical protein
MRPRLEGRAMRSQASSPRPCAISRSVSSIACSLSATPHNGHSNSFSALLEMLDPQRFTRGVEVRPRDLEPVMVRRLKSDLRRLGEAFPERRIEAIPISGLPADAPELDLARRLAAYGELRMARIPHPIVLRHSLFLPESRGCSKFLAEPTATTATRSWQPATKV